MLQPIFYICILSDACLVKRMFACGLGQLNNSSILIR